MTLHAKDYPPGTPVYSFVVEETGENFHIDADKLRQWCLAHRRELEPVWVPVSLDIAVSYITENVVDLKHVKKVAEMKQWDPLIYGKFDTFTNGKPDVMHIDGHHRYVAVAALGGVHARALSYVLPRSLWEPFRILGLPDITADYLRAVPPKTRKQETDHG